MSGKKEASRRAFMKRASVAAGASVISTVAGPGQAQQKPAVAAKNTIKPGVTPDSPVFRFRRPDGSMGAVTITPEMIKKDPALKDMIDRLKKSAGGYGEHYEAGGGHDKEFSKGGDHDKSYSRS